MTPLTGEQVAFFAEHGWLAIEEGAPPATVARLRACCDAILADPEGLAFDPTAQARAAAPGEDPDALPGPMLYSTAEADWLEWRDDPFHAWAHQAAEALLGVPVEYWCNQFTLKPPRVGGASYWHQDDGYVGAGEEPYQVACWLTLDDTDSENGCLQYTDRAHRDGLLPALLPTPAGSPRLDWRPDPEGVVTCSLPAGGVLFHHGKTPHGAPPNRSGRWRRVFIQRFTVVGAPRPQAHAFDPGG